MEEERKKKIALFRFGVISQLIGLQKGARGPTEVIIREIVAKLWDIPFSGRSYIARSTVLEWFKRYEDGGGRLESLYPMDRCDRGRSRSLDQETELSLVNLKKELKGASLPVILKIARERKILSPDFSTSSQSIYRVFKKHGVDVEDVVREDIRRYEAELPNDLWQSDCMHGPMVEVEGKQRKVFLFAFIDDHSRLIPHAEFYLKENLESFTSCLGKALSKRGLPRKLYTDNGPTFRSHHLGHITASIGIALLHSTPYRPEGRGKIERWFKTVRMRFLPALPSIINLCELNERLSEWIDKDYHIQIHSSIKEKPLDRYLRHLHLIRQVPANLNDYFRHRAVRKVDKDRTISLCGRVYEGPVELIGSNVSLLYHEDDPHRVEVFYKDKSYGFLVPLNEHINCRIRRGRRCTEIVSRDESKDIPNDEKPYRGGSLFERRQDDDEL